MSAGRFYVDSTARIGVPLRMLQGCVWSQGSLEAVAPTLPLSLYVGPYALVGHDVKLGEGVVIDAFCSIEPRAVVGARTVLVYRSTVGGGAVVGEDCVVGGFISENCHVGSRCRVMGQLIHSHADPTMSWDHHEVPEVSPRLHDDVFVGFGALVIGAVTLHQFAYVCAGAVITRDVPMRHVAYGKNKIVPFSEWPGSLKASPFFQGPE